MRQGFLHLLLIVIVMHIYYQPGNSLRLMRHFLEFLQITSAVRTVISTIVVQLFANLTQFHFF